MKPAQIPVLSISQSSSAEPGNIMDLQVSSDRVSDSSIKFKNQDIILTFELPSIIGEY